MSEAPAFIGTAGWGIAGRHAHLFPGSGTHLERYARCLGAVEINSSFYRPHRRETYARWAGSVPDGFRFSVKLPKAITHEKRLAGCETLLDAFLESVSGLGDRLGVLLVQLPPSLPFDIAVAEPILRRLRQSTAAGLACEPRHASWFGAEPAAVLNELRIARVQADPAPFPEAAEPGGWPQLAYLRWHGTPRIYYSDYAPRQLAAIDRQVMLLHRAGRETWCIFDNTAEGHALANAAALAGLA